MNYKGVISYLFAVFLILIILFFPYLFFPKENLQNESSLRILTYSSFIKSWGAGPEIAEKFFQETGIKIKWLNSGNAGLLLERLRFKGNSDRPDVVLGFDQFSLREAQQNFQWQDIHRPSDFPSALPQEALRKEFVAYDWGPMTFIYKGQLEPLPQKLSDLTQKAYQAKLILQDPRMSSPGLQFLIWVVSEMGEQGAIDFLKRLKPSIQTITPSWSSAYSLFKIEPSSLVFSYLSSPYFHLLEEKNKDFHALKFNHPHPIQVEYAGIPRSCQSCDLAQKFITFLLSEKSQKILMKHNYMYPVNKKALQGSVFRLPEGLQYYGPLKNREMIKKKKELVKIWKKVFY